MFRVTSLWCISLGCGIYKLFYGKRNICIAVNVNLMTQEYSEYVEAVVANASEMITAIEMTKEELIRTLGDENHGSVLRFADEMTDSVIAEAYRGAMVPFMSPATEEREEEEGEAGSDDEREVRGERR